MSTNHTPNYNLNQWEKSDKVQMEDFNSDNAKIDTALAGKAEQTAVDALARTVAGHGATLSTFRNCRAYLTTYTGTGNNKYDSNGHAAPEDCPQIKLPAIPDVLIVIGGSYIMYYLPETGNIAYLLGGRMYGRFGVNWNGTTAVIELVENNESSCMNSALTYYAIALYRVE